VRQRLAEDREDVAMMRCWYVVFITAAALMVACGQPTRDCNALKSAAAPVTAALRASAPAKVGSRDHIARRAEGRAAVLADLADHATKIDSAATRYSDHAGLSKSAGEKLRDACRP